MADEEQLYLELYDNCRKGLIEMVAFYLQTGLDASWTNRRDRNRSLLMATAWKDSEDVCKLLLKANAVVNHTDTANMTALHICAKQNAHKVAKLLLECKDVDPNALAENRVTPLMICADLRHTEIGKLLLNHPNINLDIQSSRGFTALMKAVFENSDELAVELIQKGSKLDLSTNGGFTVLHLCAQLDRMELAKKIIARLKKDGNFKDLINKPTSQEFKRNAALTLAALNGHVEMAKLLLDEGANINEKNIDGATALDQVKRLGGSSQEMIKCLQEFQSETQQEVTFDQMREAIAKEDKSEVQNQLEVFKIAKQESDEDSKKASSLLMQAAAVGNRDILLLLIAKISEVAGEDAINWVAGKENATPLHAAIQSGSNECIRLLIERGANTSIQNQQGFNALHLCAEVNASEDTVQEVLKNAKTSDLQKGDNDGRTPLEIAAIRGSIMTLRQLLLQRQQSEMQQDAGDLEKLRKLAEEEKKYEAADLVLQFIPQVPSKKGKEDQQLLVNQLFMASMKRNKDDVELLLKDSKVLSLGEKLFNAKFQHEPKWTALMATAWNNDEAICDLLLRQGADPNVTDDDLGITALHIAVQQNSKRVVAKLLDMKICNVDARSKDRRTPLIRAAWLDHRDIGKLLLDRRADVNAQELDGFSALHFCAQENLVEFAKQLICYQADLELKTQPKKHSNTAFTLAAIRGHVEMLELLANVGADIYYESKYGNAIDLARRWPTPQHNVVSKLLELDKERRASWSSEPCKQDLQQLKTPARVMIPCSMDVFCADRPTVSQNPGQCLVEYNLNSSTVPRILGTEYSMTENPRGLCVIINNNDFLCQSSRLGSLKDEDSLVALFKDTLKFRVQLHRNLDSVDIKATMLSAAKAERHAKYDCFVAFIMSHGEEGAVLGSDDVSVNLKDEIYDPFRKCTSLEGKPKLFFVQACRTASEASFNMPPQQQPQSYGSQSDSRGLCNAIDFLYAYATIQGDFAVRHVTEGSIYVQTLCKVFTENYRQHHLMDMLQTVRSRMGCERYMLNSSTVVFDIPCEETLLRGHVFFRDLQTAS